MLSGVLRYKKKSFRDGGFVRSPIRKELRKTLQKKFLSYGVWNSAIFVTAFFICLVLILYMGIKGIKTFLSHISLKLYNGDCTKKWAPSASYDITLCTIVRNDVPYLLEWMVFHKMQGVNHFVLYDDQSIDGLPLIEDLLKQAGDCDLVEVIPAAVPTFEMRWHDGSVHEFRLSHERILNHCMWYMKNRTKWLLMTDTDEFVFPMSAPTLTAELKRKVYKNVSFVHLKDVRFGSNNVKSRHKIFFSLNEVTGKVELFYADKASLDFKKLRGKKDEYPLIIDTHVRRMRVHELDRITLPLDPQCYFLNGSVMEECQPGNGKTLMRSGSCSVFLNHACVNATNGKRIASQTLRANPRTQIRLNHFYIRSADENNNMPSRKYSKRKSYQLFDKSVYSTIYDNYLIRKYATQLRDNLQHFIT